MQEKRIECVNYEMIELDFQGLIHKKCIQRQTKHTKKLTTKTKHQRPIMDLTRIYTARVKKLYFTRSVENDA